MRMRKRPKAVRVPLGGKSFISVRPATQFECDVALARTRREMAGLIEAAELAEQLAVILGADFDVSGLSDKDKYVAAARRLSDVYLVMNCQEGWEGMELELEDGSVTLIETPTPGGVALLLADPLCYAPVMAVINARIHLEDAEGNASPVSPPGGAGILDGAVNAAPAASLAPTAAASPPRTLN